MRSCGALLFSCRRCWAYRLARSAHVHFLLRDRTVLNTLRDNEHLARSKRNGSIAQLDVELSLEDEKKIICLVMLVPNKLPLHLYDHHVVGVELRHGSAVAPVV